MRLSLIFILPLSILVMSCSTVANGSNSIITPTPPQSVMLENTPTPALAKKESVQITPTPQVTTSTSAAPSPTQTITDPSSSTLKPSPTLNDAATQSITSIEPIPSVTSNVSINTGPNNLSQLQNLKTLKIKTDGYNTYSQWIPAQNSWFSPANRQPKLGPGIESVDMPVTWNGTSFSGSWTIDPTYIDPDPKKQNDPKRDIKATVNGIVSEDGNNLITLNYNYEGNQYNDKTINKRNYSYLMRNIQLQNVPLNDPLNGIGYFEERGSQIKDYIVNLEYLDRTYARSSLNYEFEYVSTDWTAIGARAPSLSVQFSR